MKLEMITEDAADILANDQLLRIREYDCAAELEFMVDENPVAIIKINQSLFVRSFKTREAALEMKTDADNKEGVFSAMGVQIQWFGL